MKWWGMHCPEGIDRISRADACRAFRTEEERDAWVAEDVGRRCPVRAEQVDEDDVRSRCRMLDGSVVEWCAPSDWYYESDAWDDFDWEVER